LVLEFFGFSFLSKKKNKTLQKIFKIFMFYFIIFFGNLLIIKVDH